MGSVAFKSSEESDKSYKYKFKHYSAKAIMEKIEKNKIAGLSSRRHRHFLDSDWWRNIFLYNRAVNQPPPPPNLWPFLEEYFNNKNHVQSADPVVSVKEEFAIKSTLYWTLYHKLASALISTRLKYVTATCAPVGSLFKCNKITQYIAVFVLAYYIFDSTPENIDQAWRSR